MGQTVEFLYNLGCKELWAGLLFSVTAHISTTVFTPGPGDTIFVFPKKEEREAGESCQIEPVETFDFLEGDIKKLKKKKNMSHYGENRNLTLKKSQTKGTNN